MTVSTLVGNLVAGMFECKMQEPSWKRRRDLTLVGTKLLGVSALQPFAGSVSARARLNAR